MVKHFVLDTNILLHYPTAMVDGFDDNHVIITGTTLQELDKKKEMRGEIGYNAREAIRILDSLREKGDLLKGVSLPNKGKLSIEPDGINVKNLPQGYSLDVADNRIISTCVYLNERYYTKYPVRLVTNDISLRVNASTCGILVESYRNDHVGQSEYTGHVDLDVDKMLIDEVYATKRVNWKSDELLENQFVTLHAGSSSCLSVFRRGCLELIQPKTFCSWIKPLNAMQTYAMWALSQPHDELPLVILCGVAGTAKTFLSLAAGMDSTYVKLSTGDKSYKRMKNRTNSIYDKIILSRPTTGYEGLGFLPGDLEQKLDPLVRSFYDNMEQILKQGNAEESYEQIKMQMDDILSSGVVELCALDFIRGRSISDAYIICDECQNAAQPKIRDVVTRTAKRSKMVLAGDPSQIDIPTLDAWNNGLVYAKECMKGSSTTAIVTFESKQSVRSPLAKEALERMK